jgi:hypothetical protein
MSTSVNSPRRRQLTDFERGEIVGAWKCSLTEQEISDVLKRPKPTVHTVIDKYKQFGRTTVARRKGKPRKLDHRAVRRLVNIVKEDRRQAVDEITEKFNTAMAISTSSKTIRRTLHENEFFGRAGLRKPLVTEKNRQERLKWCLERKDWNIEWELVIWSDESRYLLFKNDSRRWVWRRPHEKYDVECLIPTVKNKDGVMVWGCFSQNALGPLIEVEGTITGLKYLEVLKENLEPFINTLPVNLLHLFQDDNAKVHRIPAVNEWKEDNSISSLPWPAQSPDLNPIEHLWDVLDRRVRGRQNTPKNKTELMDVLVEEWQKIEPEILKNLVESMPRRIQAVIDAKGNPTRY